MAESRMVYFLRSGERPSIDNRLYEAIANRKLNDVKRLFDETPAPTIDPKLPSHQTWLHVASEHRFSEAIDFLLEKKVPLEAQDENGLTALHVALELNSRTPLTTRERATIDALVRSIRQRQEKSAIINLRTKLGETALHYAAKYIQEVEIIGLLLDAGAETNCQSSEGETPAQVAVRYHNWRTARVILQKHSDVFQDVQSPDNSDLLSCFQYAASSSDWGMLQECSTELESISTKMSFPAPWLAALQVSWKTMCDGAYLESKYKEMARLAYLDFRFGKSKAVFGWLETSFPSHQYTRPVIGEQRIPPPMKRRPTQQFNGSTAYTFSTNNIPGTLALIHALSQDDILSPPHLECLWQDITSEQQFGDRENHPNAMSIRLREPAYNKISDTACYYISIVMPCFHLHTLGDIDYWRNPEMASERTNLIAKNWDLFSSTSPQYFGVQMALTLDEYCSPALPKSVLDQRNLDQVILKARGKEVQNTNGKFRRTAHILAVSQMWLWELEDVLIVSPSTIRRKKERQAEESSFSLASGENIASKVATRLNEAIPRTEDGKIMPLYTKLSMDVLPYVEKAKKSADRSRAIGIMLSEAVDFLEHPSDNRHDQKPLFNIYERYITVVGQKADAYSKDTGLAKIDIVEERKYLHDIDDIRAELAMIKRVISQQEEVWRDFASSTWPQYWPSGPENRMVISVVDLYNMSNQERNEWIKIMRPQSQFEKYRRRIGQLDEDSARVERAILAKLDLKQKHASLREAHAAGVISAAVLGFTVITIIFTPLSFLTSLFALPIDRFQKHQVDWFVPGPRNETSQTNMTRAYTGNYVGKWAATAEIASIVVAVGAMWLAIEYTVEERLTTKLWNWMQKFLHVQPKPTEEANEKYPDDIEPPSRPTSNEPELQPEPQPGPKPEPVSEPDSRDESRSKNPHKIEQYLAEITRRRSGQNTNQSIV